MDEQPLEEQIPFIWCLVGNIVEKHEYGENHEIKYGTKHFSRNTKVYCFKERKGNYNIKVIGLHRKSRKYTCIIMPLKLITNWRLQKVYSPVVLKLMQSGYSWTNSDEDKEIILSMLEWLPEMTVKIDE